MHASISAHIAKKYEGNNLYGPNPTLQYEEVLKHPELVKTYISHFYLFFEQ